jgi:hypothetical protein
MAARFVTHVTDLDLTPSPLWSKRADRHELATVPLRIPDDTVNSSVRIQPDGTLRGQVGRKSEGKGTRHAPNPCRRVCNRCLHLGRPERRSYGDGPKYCAGQPHVFAVQREHPPCAPPEGPPGTCDANGVCGQLWCPGSGMGGIPNWDMNVCRTFYFDPNAPLTKPIIIQGQPPGPPAPPPPPCIPLVNCLPGL